MSKHFHTLRDVFRTLNAARYKGTSGGSDVIGLLTDIAADFASMEAGARADETTQQDEYDTWLTGAQIDKSRRTACRRFCFSCAG